MKKEINAFVKTLKEENLTVSFAESMTCGLVSHKLSTCPGVSEVLKGSVVCYTPEIKNSLLGVKPAMMKAYTCESMEVTEALTKGLRQLIASDIHAAVTGLASAGGTEHKNKPVGTVFFCVLYKRKYFKFKKVFRGTPSVIKEKACLALYHFILSEVI